MVHRTAPKGAHRRAAAFAVAGLLGLSSGKAATLVTTLQADTIGSTTFRGYAPFLELYAMEELRITGVSWTFDPNGSETSITVSLVDLRDRTVLGNFETDKIVDGMAVQPLSIQDPNGITIPAGMPFAILVGGNGGAEFPMVETPQNELSALQYFGTRAYFVERVPEQSLRNFVGSASFSIEGEVLSGSGLPIPEPSSALMIAGGIVLLGRRQRRS